MSDRTESRGPSAHDLLYGEGGPVDKVVTVEAGALSAEFIGGALRYLKLGGIEVARRVLVAVRDGAWNTVPGRLSEVVVEEADGLTSIRFNSRNVSGDLDFGWRGLIRLLADGSCDFSMDGVANTAFDYRRIGICVLHPIGEFAGQPYVASTRDSTFKGNLPDLVAPPQLEEGVFVPLVPAFERLALSNSRLRAAFSFTGDLFEIEDQRNWTDASFKSYSRFPVPGAIPEHAPLGTRISQSVSISAEGLMPRPRRDSTRLALTVGRELHSKMPLAGVAHAAESPATESRQALDGLAPCHLRVDVHLRDRDWANGLQQAAREAIDLGCPLELAVFLSDRPDAQLELLASALTSAQISRILVYSEDVPTTAAADVASAREVLAGVVPQVPIGGGTDLHFAELNQYRPDMASMDVVAFPITPQVHASDESSMVETPEALRTILRTAQSFCGDRLIAVSPISLRARFNPDAPEDANSPPTGVADNVDPRQASLFAAVWTLATMKALAEGGAYSTTWYETVGPRGLATIDPDDARLPAGSRGGLVFPIYHVIRDLSEHRRASLLACTSDDPLRVEAMAVRSGDRTSVLVANLQPVRRAVELRLELPARSAPVTVRRLNTQTGRRAMLDPQGFRRQLRSHPSDGNVVRIDLLAYEYSRFEFEHQSDRGG